MREEGLDVWGRAGDVTRQEDVDALFAEALDRFGGLDVLVNCAGRTDRGKVLDTTPEDFESLLTLNFLATVRCTRAARGAFDPAPGAHRQHGIAGREIGPLGG